MHADYVEGMCLLPYAGALAEYMYTDPAYAYRWRIYAIQGFGKLDADALCSHKVKLAGRRCLYR